VNQSFWIYWHRVLGEGGEGRVHLAYNFQTGTLCVVKVSLCPVPHVAAHYLGNEVERALRARGQHVMRPLAYNLEGPTPFIAYELAQGTLGDEFQQMRARGAVYHPRWALERAIQLLGAVADAHNSGLVHRDVKPDNVMRIGDDLKLGDWGLGRTIDRPAVLQTQAFVGTRNYASPEQVVGYPVDHRADLYAVGVILYEMLVGVRPGFERPLRPPSSYYPNITKDLDTFVWSLLSILPSMRPQTTHVALAWARQIAGQYRVLRWASQHLTLPFPY